MEEENKIIEKSLEDNYLKIKIEEIEVGEKLDVLVVDFSKNTADLISNFKAEQKEVDKQKARVNTKYELKLNKMKEKHESQIESLQSSKKVIEENYDKELLASKTLRDSEIQLVKETIKDLDADYLKQVDQVLKEYESKIEQSKEDMIVINAKAEEDKEKLHKEFETEKAKHEAILADLNGDIADKIDKFTGECNLKIEKANKAILIEEGKYEKELAELKASCEEKMATFEADSIIEQEDFDAKHHEISSTLEAKVTRHEKFMNRSIENKDQRSAKQHKKEIGILQKNAEKELKTLTDAHLDYINNYESKKRNLEEENLAVVAELSKKLTEFKDKELFEISLHKAELNSGLESFKFDIDMKIQEEINRFNIFSKDNKIELAGLILKQETDIEKEIEIQSKLQIAFEKENALNKVKQAEKLAIKENELKNIEENHNLRLHLADINKSIELSKVDYEIDLAKKTLELNIKVNEEQKNIELIDLDTIVSGTISGRNTSLQNEINILFDSKENFLLAFEEEVYKKTLQTPKSILAKKSKIESEKAGFIARINTAFMAEQALYEEKLAAGETEELKTYKKDLDNRLNTSIKQIETFFNNELSHLDADKENLDAKERQLKIFESSSLLLQSAQLRNSKLIDTDSPNDNVNIKNYRTAYEKQKSAIKVSYDKVLSDFDKGIKSEEALSTKAKSLEGNELSKQVNAFNKEMKDIENLEIKNLKADDSLHNVKYSKLQSNENLAIKNAEQEYSLNAVEFKENVAKIDKVAGIIHKNLEDTKKTLKKDYDTNLAKKLSDINLKLQEDIKNIQ